MFRLSALRSGSRPGLGDFSSLQLREHLDDQVRSMVEKELCGTRQTRLSLPSTSILTKSGYGWVLSSSSMVLV